MFAPLWLTSFKLFTIATPLRAFEIKILEIMHAGLVPSASKRSYLRYFLFLQNVLRIVTISSLDGMLGVHASIPPQRGARVHC